MSVLCLALPHYSYRHFSIHMLCEFFTFDIRVMLYRYQILQIYEFLWTFHTSGSDISVQLHHFLHDLNSTIRFSFVCYGHSLPHHHAQAFYWFQLCMHCVEVYFLRPWTMHDTYPGFGFLFAPIHNRINCYFIYHSCCLLLSSPPMCYMAKCLNWRDKQAQHQIIHTKNHVYEK